MDLFLSCLGLCSKAKADEQKEDKPEAVKDVAKDGGGEVKDGGEGGDFRGGGGLPEAEGGAGLGGEEKGADGVVDERGEKVEVFERGSSWAQVVSGGGPSAHSHVDNNKHASAPRPLAPTFGGGGGGEGAEEREEVFPPSHDSNADLTPSPEELQNIADACAKLWSLDTNRLVPGRDYEVDLQEGKRANDRGDVAEGSLFSFVNEDVFSRPTYSKFYALLDNYAPNVGEEEVETTEEKQEERAFVEEISNTPVIIYLYNYLRTKQLFNGEWAQFKAEIARLWFRKYGRGGSRQSSSAFEHVFVGEVKIARGGGGEEVTGFHNWISIFIEEKKGALNYYGYILPRGRNADEPDPDGHLLTVQFGWNGLTKKLSSVLVGVSPEFELALYTLCFYEGSQNTRIIVGKDKANVVVYPMRDGIGSAYVEDCD